MDINRHIVRATWLATTIFGMSPFIAGAQSQDEAPPFEGVRLTAFQPDTSAEVPKGPQPNERQLTMARQSESETLRPYLEPPANLVFRSNSAELENHWYGAVGRIADTLQEHPKLQVVLVGHTDLIGSRDYNRDLSRRRAIHIAEILATDFAIARERILVHGAGADDPLENDVSPASNAKNRRVEILFKQG